MNSLRGSQWNKWDLHVHTPKSIIQGYGGDTPEAWEKFITDLEALPISYKVIGINDYIFLDGYKEVIKYKSQGRLSNIDLILPVIELRIDKFGTIGDEAWKKINLHVIFSDTLTPAIIETQFLSSIQHKLTISPDIEGVNFQGVVTREALEQIGKQIKETATVTINDSDLKTGFNNLLFDYKTVKKVLEGSYFEGKHLTAVGKCEWDAMRWDGSAATKKTIINEANFSFASLETPAIWQKHVTSLDNMKVRSCLLDCSDAHHFSDSQNKDRIGNSFTWLKADTTFEGLKQISNEKQRIYVGDEPPLLTRVRTNPTKYIQRLDINKIESSIIDEIWFDKFSLELNSSLVAIIGNKGNGKSAIADTLGLIGNTKNFGDFSFLTTSKFRKRKPYNKSEHFEGMIVWESGSEDKTLLSLDPHHTSFEKIKYIPQGFLEKLCNEDAEEFESELRKVIFSHISDGEKLGKDSLDELIEYKTEIINQEIESIKYDLLTTNKAIIELEKKSSPEFKLSVEENLKMRELELSAIDALKPIQVEPPTDPDIEKRNKEISDKIQIARSTLESLESVLKQKIEEEKTLIFQITELDKVVQSLTGFGEQYLKLKENVETVLAEHSIVIADVITLNINPQKIIDTIEALRVKEKGIATEILDETENGINSKITQEKENIQNFQQNLDEPAKKYQKYLDEYKAWEKQRESVIGAVDKVGTITNLQSTIAYLTDKLGEELAQRFDSRKELIEKLFSRKAEIIDLYRSLFKPIADFITNHGEAMDEQKIILDVDYKLAGFEEKFFDHVSLGAKGSFIGNPAGAERLRNILEKNELKNVDGITAFLSEIIESLKVDKRDHFNGESRQVDDQLKKQYSSIDLYTFLFNLDYLVPTYKLKLGEKDINELSPGERGALLLIFYLTLDRDDIPLIIDQPEENLDNQSVFKILVHFIKEAKSKRQIIIVTHNPNLAVVCDAEQVINIRINKQNKNQVEFSSGSLENPEINTLVLDILEGTFPAFNNRTSKYKIIDRK